MTNVELSPPWTRERIEALKAELERYEIARKEDADRIDAQFAELTEWRHVYAFKVTWAKRWKIVAKRLWARIKSLESQCVMWRNMYNGAWERYANAKEERNRAIHNLELKSVALDQKQQEIDHLRRLLAEREIPFAAESVSYHAPDDDDVPFPLEYTITSVEDVTGTTYTLDTAPHNEDPLYETAFPANDNPYPNTSGVLRMTGAVGRGKL